MNVDKIGRGCVEKKCDTYGERIIGRKKPAFWRICPRKFDK
jgi:hypothetical protein